VSDGVWSDNTFTVHRSRFPYIKKYELCNAAIEAVKYAKYLADMVDIINGTNCSLLYHPRFTGYITTFYYNCC